MVAERIETDRLLCSGQSQVVDLKVSRKTLPARMNQIVNPDLTGMGFHHQEVEEECGRMAILPGGMYAHVRDIYIEDTQNRRGFGRHIYAIPLEAILERYGRLEEGYSRVRRENIALKQKLWAEYSKRSSSFA